MKILVCTKIFDPVIKYFYFNILSMLDFAGIFDLIRKIKF
jgi:hypothetical protein